MSGREASVNLKGQGRLGYRHQKIQRLKKLLRRKEVRNTEGVFVAEGPKLLAEAVISGADIESVYVEAAYRCDALEQAIANGVRVFEVLPDVIAHIGDTVTPQPVLAVVRQPSCDLSQLVINEARSVLVMVDVRDPGNAGTILRSAEAAGIDVVVMCEGCVDAFSPKTVRSSAGSIFYVPVVTNADGAEVVDFLKTHSFITAGTAMTGGTVYDQADFTRKMALFLGNEANGLPADVTKSLDEMISIPIAGRSESLNVSMAASVLCFESARQRRVNMHAGDAAQPELTSERLVRLGKTND